MRNLALAAAALAAMVVWSVAPASAQSRLALVIGNSAYTGAPALATTIADATLIAKTLQDAGYDVTGLANIDRASLPGVIGQFRDKLAAAGPDAVAFIYLAGYGAQYNADDYFLPVDAQVNSPEDLPSQAPSLSTIIAALAQVPSAARIIVLDGSRDGGLGKAAGKPVPPGLALIGVPSGFLVAYAAAPNATAPDGNGSNSPFASALATVMQQPGLDIEQILKGVRLQVNQASDGTQTPWMTSALNAEVKLFEAAPAAGLDANAQAAPQTLAPALGVANIPVPPKTKRHVTKAVIRSMPADQAYRTVIEDDSLQDYQWFVEAHPQYSLAGQIWDIINNRRESILWHRTLTLGTTRAYWNYLKRYPDGVHAWEARNWLSSNGEPLPPTDYIASPDVLPPGYYDEAVGLPDIVPDGFVAPADVFDSLAPIFVPRPKPWQPKQVIINVNTPQNPPKNAVPANNPVTPQPNSNGNNAGNTPQPIVNQPVQPINVNPPNSGSSNQNSGGSQANSSPSNLKNMTDQQLLNEAAKQIKQYQNQHPSANAQPGTNQQQAIPFPNQPKNGPTIVGKPADADQNKQMQALQQRLKAQGQQQDQRKLSDTQLNNLLNDLNNTNTQPATSTNSAKQTQPPNGGGANSLGAIDADKAAGGGQATARHGQPNTKQQPVSLPMHKATPQEQKQIDALRQRLSPADRARFDQLRNQRNGGTSTANANPNGGGAQLDEATPGQGSKRAPALHSKGLAIPGRHQNTGGQHPVNNANLRPGQQPANTQHQLGIPNGQRPVNNANLRPGQQPANTQHQLGVPNRQQLPVNNANLRPGQSPANTQHQLGIPNRQQHPVNNANLRPGQQPANTQRQLGIPNRQQHPVNNANLRPGQQPANTQHQLGIPNGQHPVNNANLRSGQQPGNAQRQLGIPNRQQHPVNNANLRPGQQQPRNEPHRLGIPPKPNANAKREQPFMQFNSHPTGQSQPANRNANARPNQPLNTRQGVRPGQPTEQRRMEEIRRANADHQRQERELQAKREQDQRAATERMKKQMQDEANRRKSQQGQQGRQNQNQQQRALLERQNQQRQLQERQNQQRQLREHQNQQRATRERQNQQRAMQERQNQQRQMQERQRQQQQRAMQERQNQQHAMQQREMQQRAMQQREMQQRAMQQRQMQMRQMQQQHSGGGCPNGMHMTNHGCSR